MRWSTWVERGLDESYWRSHRVQTDITFAIEQGFGFIGSSRWTLAEGATDFVVIDIPQGVTMRLYDRIVAVGGGPFDIDVIQVSSIDLNGTAFNKSCLNCIAATSPTVSIRRGATNPVIEVVREESFIPAQRGPQSAGAIQSELTYRVLGFVDGLRLAYRVKNNDNKANTVNMTFVWTEEYPDDG